jgi:hypothetical protein
MSLSDGNNPSNKTGPIQSNFVVQALVVDDKDPEEAGRFKCRIFGEQDDIGQIPDEQLQWISCIQPGSGQIRQVGSWPPGKYMKGSRVTLLNMGAQGWSVLGAISNDGVNKDNQKDDKQQDIHHTATSKSPLQIISALGNVARGVVNGTDFRNLPSTTQALLKLNSTVQAFKQNPIKAILNLAPVPDIYGGRRQVKVPEGLFKSIGVEKYFGQVGNAQQFMQLAGATSLIPNALGMLEQLKQTATQALNIPMIDSVGGLGNILGALQGIQSAFNSTNQGTQQQDQQNLEEELRRIYKVITNKEPLDKFGNETLDYKTWKENYLNGVYTV